jgi:hypothetical protein
MIKKRASIGSPFFYGVNSAYKEAACFVNLDFKFAALFI